MRLPAEPASSKDKPVLSSKLTINYRFMLEHAFGGGHEYVIVLEDDLEIARDALRFFALAVQVCYQLNLHADS